MKFLKHLFSVKKCGTNHKKINILGIKIKYKCQSDIMKPYLSLPIENNKIIFRTCNGGYSCNPKYIAEEIIKQKLPYKLVWVVDENILNFIDDFPRDKMKLVMAGTAEEIKETLTAQFIIDNERRSKYIKEGIYKREGQKYIQTFHGSLGIKKTGIDRNDTSKKKLKPAKIDSLAVDYLISNSTFVTEFFKRMFWNHGEILEYGHPRNDIFFKNKEEQNEIRAKVYKYYNIPQNKKIIMYAPTLREDNDMTCFSLDVEKTVQAISKKFNDDWVVIIRLHPWLLNYKDKFTPKGSNIIDATSYSDMQELLVASDILITDYSSCVYDFMLQYKPAFIFATDIKKYDNTRGLYYPLSSTPFPVAETNDELVEKIENFDYESYKENVAEFLKGKGCIEDGHASERVVELIKSISSNNK
jgi:CDP-glycerol glycerophosphotransferase